MLPMFIELEDGEVSQRARDKTTLRSLEFENN